MMKKVILFLTIICLLSCVAFSTPASAADYTNDAEYQTFTEVGMGLFDMQNPGDYNAWIWLRDPEAFHITYFEAKGEFDAVRFSALTDGLGTQKWLFQILEEDGETVIREVEQTVLQGDDGINIVKFNPVPAGSYALKVSTVDDYEPGDNAGNPKYYVVLPAGQILKEYRDTCYTEVYGALFSTDNEASLIMNCESALAFGIHLTGRDKVQTPTPTQKPTSKPVSTTKPVATTAPVSTMKPTESAVLSETASSDKTPNKPTETGDFENTYKPEGTAPAYVTAIDSTDKDGGISSTVKILVFLSSVVVFIGATAVFIMLLKKFR